MEPKSLRHQWVQFYVETNGRYENINLRYEINQQCNQINEQLDPITDLSQARELLRQFSLNH